MKILVVDDDCNIRQLIISLLTNEGHIVEEAQDGCYAIERYTHENFDLVITDVEMPRKDGKQLLKNILEIKPSAIVVCMSGSSTTEDAEEMIKLGASYFLSKPFNIVTLLDIIQKIITFQTQEEINVL